jgi:hypothetical protein
VSLGEDERVFLSDITAMLNSVDHTNTQDPASTRMRLPVYLDDFESTEEWWRLMGDQLETARERDRSVFDRVMSAPPGGVVLETDEAESLLRVVNEGRLVLASRLGVQIASDFDDLDPDARMALDFMNWLLEDLTSELSGQF